MGSEIFKRLLLNIGLLIIIAQLLTRIRVVKSSVVEENNSIKDKLIMIFIFTMISIISTYTGYGVRDAYANTRVIGVMASGFIGGPVVAMGVATLASLHRYLIDINGFASVACSISTLLGGVIAALSTKRIKKNNYRSSDLFFITFIAESLQMLIILLIAKPYSEALALVKEIAIPMTIFNPLGMVLFVGVFRSIIIEQENNIGRKVNLSFDITKKCLPILQTGLYNEEHCKKIGDIILEFSNDIAVIFTDKEKILSISGNVKTLEENNQLPSLSEIVMNSKGVIIDEDFKNDDILHDSLKNKIGIGAPLIKNNEVFGTMIILTKKYRISSQSQVQFADGLSKLLSTQYELADMEKQKDLLAMAEYHALQSQINPHFIFNALNTISSFTREKPDKARELLIALATYFRNSIQTENAFISIYDEMEYVDAYLQLVKARFDDRLDVSISIPENLNYMVPCLIVQPIVENAVMHGAMKRKMGKVEIKIVEHSDGLIISVTDNGFGIPEKIIDDIKNNSVESSKVGLFNVHKRLLYIYGIDNGLDIISSENGTRINLSIKKKTNENLNLI